MAGWEESADKPVLAAPVLRPGDVFPPRPPEAPRRRRFHWPIWVALLVALAVGAGVLVYVTGRTSTPSQAEQVAAVRKAYLAWWGARKEAYLKLDPAPLRPYMTASGFMAESAELEQQKQANEPIQIVVPNHDMQIVVYQEGVYASVDDIWKSEDVSVDPKTHNPTSQPANNLSELSATLKLVAGRWLVDGKIDFGSSDGVSGTHISYAAVPGDQPSETLRSQVGDAFRTYESTRVTAYLRLDPKALETVEIQPYLGDDQQLLGEQLAKNEPFRYSQQDNFRIGVQDATHVWIYDTFFERGQTLDRATGRSKGGIQSFIDHFAYEMTQGASGWMVSDAGHNYSS